jgi:hypothetical protein
MLLNWLKYLPSQDVAWLISGLNATGFLLGSYQVPDPTFNHLDFLYGIDADSFIYDRVLQQLDRLA